MAEKRSSSRINAIQWTLLGELYKERDEEDMDTRYLICGKWLLERMMSICKKEKGKFNTSAQEASRIVAKQLRQDWIDKNVYPKKEDNVALKIRTDYETFKNFIKQNKSKAGEQRTKEWQAKVRTFNERMTKNAYDIRTSDETYQKKLEEMHGVRMTSNDNDYYNDNCFGSYIATCERKVCKAWKKTEERKEKRRKTEEEKREREVERNKEGKERKSQYLKEQEEINVTLEKEEYVPPQIIPQESDKIQTRSRESQESAQIKSSFPMVRVRKSYRALNEAVLRCTAQCFAAYKVSAADLIGIIVTTANTIFEQDWKISKKEREETEEDEERDDRGDEERDQEVVESKVSESSSLPKRRKMLEDYSYVFPAVRSLNRYLEDASYLNLHMVAELIKNKGSNVVTIGLDDTKKAAGHKLYDIKADHITIKGPNQKRKSYTTGYAENISHSGEDGAETYKYKLGVLAALTDSSVDEMLEQVDFWMTD